MSQITDDVPALRLQGLAWRKSQYSNPSGNCVELAVLPDGDVAVRNSRHPGGPALIYTRAELTAFIHGTKDGDFDDMIDQPTGNSQHRATAKQISASEAGRPAAASAHPTSALASRPDRSR